MDPAIVIAEDLEQIAALRSAYPRALVLAVVDGPALAALDAGADSVVRRGAPRELLARVGALLRRSAGAEILCAGPIVVDPGGRRAFLDGAELALSPLEFALLACLASEPGRVFTKQTLIGACWDGRLPAGSRALETQIARLRQKLGSRAPLLLTVWSIGYRLEQAR
jgi:DNA-binding response OmpR family regulator